MRASTTAGRSDCANNPFERWIEKRADKLIVTLALVAVALTWGEGDAGRVRVGVWQDCALRDLKTVPPPTEGNCYPTALAISDTPATSS